MPILCYEITGAATPNARSTTGAEDGQLSAVLKCDHEAAQSQVYAELVANRLALFLGIPVLVGVPARASASDARLRFAALRAGERLDETFLRALEGVAGQMIGEAEATGEFAALHAGIARQAIHLRAAIADFVRTAPASGHIRRPCPRSP